MFQLKRKEDPKEEPQLELIQNQPEGTDEIVKLSYIFVSDEFKQHEPSQKKKDRCKAMYYKLGHVDKPITVIAETNENGKHPTLILVDGYIRYLFYKYFLHATYAGVKYISYDEYFKMKEEKEKDYRKWRENQQLKDVK